MRHLVAHPLDKRLLDASLRSRRIPTLRRCHTSVIRPDQLFGHALQEPGHDVIPASRTVVKLVLKVFFTQQFERATKEDGIKAEEILLGFLNDLQCEMSTSSEGRCARPYQCRSQ